MIFERSTASALRFPICPPKPDCDKCGRYGGNVRDITEPTHFEVCSTNSSRVHILSETPAAMAGAVARVYNRARGYCQGGYCGGSDGKMSPLKWKREHQIALLLAILLGGGVGLIYGFSVEDPFGHYFYWDSQVVYQSWFRLSEHLRAGDKWIPAGFVGRCDGLLGCDAGRA
jgi:hypothetical protein